LHEEILQHAYLSLRESPTNCVYIPLTQVRVHRQGEALVSDTLCHGEVTFDMPELFKDWLEVQWRRVIASHLNQPANNHHREYYVMKILAVDFTQASPPESR
jgi:hypothetical protein